MISREVVLPLVITLGFLIAATGIILYGSETVPYRVGEVVRQDVPARVRFDYEDPVQTERNREAERARAPAIYVANPALRTAIETSMRDLWQAFMAQPELEALRKTLGPKGWSLDEADLEALKELETEFEKESEKKPPKGSPFDKIVSGILARLADQNIVKRPEQLETRPTAELRPSTGAEGKPVTLDQLKYVSNAEAVKAAAAHATSILDKSPMRPDITAMIERTMAPSKGGPVPFYLYDGDLTEQEAERAAAAVEPTIEEVDPGVALIKAGTTATQANLDLLRLEQDRYREAVQHDPALRREEILSDVGMALMVLLLTGGLATYTKVNQPRVVRNPMRALASAGLLLVMIAAARAVVLLAWPAELVVACVVITGAILTMAYTQRFALGITTGLCILITLTVSGMGKGGTSLLVMLLAAAAVTIVLLKEVRTRTRLIEVGAFGALATFAATTGAGLVGRQTLEFVLMHAGIAGAAVLAATFFVQGMLPLIERAFRITTSLTLLEWCDANRPLLKRMAQEAPGTYNHSLVLSTMAEAATEAIGANGLLARVGALYHDIGKMNKPDYFTENQQAQINRHDKLAPTMSLLIIVGHVKDGLAMAKEYGLPTALHTFIAEHHGTTVVRYFHQMATEQRDKKVAGRHDRQVSDTEFRYPGPKPQSKETAILMLCDAVEGAARSMAEPTAGRIESLVHQMATARLMDGQLDQCDITLRELRIVEESLVKSLCRFYHSRIAYPQKSTAELTQRQGSA